MHRDTATVGFDDDRAVTIGAIDGEPGGGCEGCECRRARMTVIVVRAGNVVRVARAYSGKDTMKSFGEIVRIARDTEGDHKRKPLLVVVSEHALTEV